MKQQILKSFSVLRVFVGSIVLMQQLCVFHNLMLLLAPRLKLVLLMLLMKLVV